MRFWHRKVEQSLTVEFYDQPRGKRKAALLKAGMPYSNNPKVKFPLFDSCSGLK